MALTPQVPAAAALTGTEWQLMIQNGRLTRTQVNALIAFARAGYDTSKLPEGANNLYFTDERARNALIQQLSTKANITDIPTVPVQSVNAKTGAVVLGKADVGLGSVDNTSDANKPVSTAQKAAIDVKLDIPGAPNNRTFVFGTVYQATDKTKAAFVSATIETVYTVTLASTLSDTVELRFGPDSASVANGTGGTAVTFKSSLTGIAVSIGMGNTQRNQLAAVIPPNWFFAIRRVAGTIATIQGGFDQML